MSLLRDAFDIVDDIPIITPVGLWIPEFKDLWMADKTSNKINVRKLIPYIYFMYSYGNAYSNLPEEERVFHIKKDSEVTDELLLEYKNPLEKAIKKFELLNVPISKRAYDSQEKAMDKTIKFIDNFDLNTTDKQGRLMITPSDIYKMSKDLPDALSNLAATRRLVEADIQEMQQAIKARGGGGLSEIDEFLEEYER